MQTDKQTDRWSDGQADWSAHNPFGYIPQHGLLHLHVGGARQALRSHVGGVRQTFVECRVGLDDARRVVQVCDIRAISAAAHAAGAVVVVDNSIMAPVFQRPLDLGADISMTSATKFIGGHSDVTGGLLSVKGAELASRIYFTQVGDPV
jgi:Cys/Met metabolism PLP-dependent enzyme